MKIYTYYDNISKDGKDSKNQQLIKLWTKSWSKNGFTPIVLGRHDAEKSPFFKEFISSMRYSQEKIMGKEMLPYGLSCYLRWLAYSTQKEEKFLVADYDIINHKYKKEELEDKNHLMVGHCPCFASGSPSTFLEMCQKMCSISKNRIDLLKGKVDVWYNDQEFFFHNFSYKSPNGPLDHSDWLIISSDIPRIGENYKHGANQDKREVIHFSNHSMSQTKANFPEFQKFTNIDLRVKLISELINE